MLEPVTEPYKGKKGFENFFKSTDDIVVFIYSSELDEDVNRKVIELFAMLALEVKDRVKSKSLKFVGYDINTLGYSEVLGSMVEHPNMLLFAGKHRDKPAKVYKGEPILDNMAAYIKKFADNKIKVNLEGLDASMRNRLQM